VTAVIAWDTFACEFPPLLLDPVDPEDPEFPDDDPLAVPEEELDWFDAC